MITEAIINSPTSCLLSNLYFLIWSWAERTCIIIHSYQFHRSTEIGVFRPLVSSLGRVFSSKLKLKLALCSIRLDGDLKKKGGREVRNHKALIPQLSSNKVIKAKEGLCVSDTTGDALLSRHAA